MSAPATTTQVSTTVRASTAPPVSTAPVSTALVTSVAPTLITSTTHTSSRRHRTTTITTASSVIPTVVPYDPAEERQADSHRTNKILAGVFTSFGVIFLGLVAFQLFRCYKRRYSRNKNVPLPPPREVQQGYRSHTASMYKEYPRDLSRPPSMMMHHNSGSGLITPSGRSNAPSIDTKETGRRNSDPSRAPGQISRNDSPVNSLSGPPLTLNDEELGRRRSPLGSRSASPSNLSPPRPPSQAQVSPRPDSRTRTARPISAMVNQRNSHFGAPGSMNRNSTYDPNRRSSFYGAPHSPHARERVGLVMPQPLAPDVFNYASSGRQDTGLGSTQGSSWDSRGHLAAGSEQDHNQPLAPPRGPRPDSWVVKTHSSTASLNDTPVTSDAPSKDGTLPRGRDRVSRAEIPRS